MAGSKVKTIRGKNLGGWQRAFDDPIDLPRGRQLVTLEDAGNYITKLPKAAVRIVASLDPASVRKPNEGRCGGNECTFVEHRVDLASAAPFAVDNGDRLVVNHWRFRHRITPRTN
jgi:hypothetical protein